MIDFNKAKQNPYSKEQSILKSVEFNLDSINRGEACKFCTTDNKILAESIRNLREVDASACQGINPDVIEDIAEFRTDIFVSVFTEYKRISKNTKLAMAGGVKSM